MSGGGFPDGMRDGPRAYGPISSHIEDLIDYINTTLPFEPRQDVLWRHAIAARQMGQFIGVAITHHPQLTPDARPMTGLEDAGSDLLVQTLYLLRAASLDPEALAARALERMKDRVWEKTAPLTTLGGHATGILAHPWNGALTGTVLEGPLLRANQEEAKGGPWVLFLDHVDNDVVPMLKQWVDIGMIKGVITAHGGMLSHAANVCREWKIPCVVGIGGDLPAKTKRVKLHADMLTQRAWIECVE